MTLSAAQPMNKPVALPEFKAVLWDMDGTLVDSEPLHKKSAQIVGEEIGFPVSDELFDSTIGISYAGTYDILKATLGMTISFEEWCQRIEAAYVVLAKDVSPRGNIVDAVKHLHARGIRQAVFSNSNRASVLANTKGFLRFFDNPDAIFDFVIPVDDVTKGKPDPEGYLMAAKRMGLEPHQCLVIEDSPTGLRAGKAAGCFTIFWPEHAPNIALPVEPDLLTDDAVSVLLSV